MSTRRIGLNLLLPAVLLVASAPAFGQVRGPWELQLGAGGVSEKSFRGFAGALNVSAGYFVLDNLELSLRQTLAYTDLGVPKTFIGATRFGVDYHFPLGERQQFLPYLGVNIGYLYGDEAADLIEFAPEAGLKWFASSDVFLFLQLEYQSLVKSGADFTTAFSNGQWVITSGIGIRF